LPLLYDGVGAEASKPNTTIGQVLNLAAASDSPKAGNAVMEIDIKGSPPEGLVDVSTEAVISPEVP
jgi:hypothetical protein